MKHKNTPMTQPAKSGHAARNGGNGGYAQRKECSCEPKNRRAYNLRDYNGKLYPGDTQRSGK